MENTDTEKNKNEVTAIKEVDSSSFFDGDSDFQTVFKKTEKLASATYMVTNLFSDNEPMKWTLRKKVSELLSLMITFKDIRQPDFASFNQATKLKVSEIVSLYEVSTVGGLVSQMNFSILKQEFFNLTELLNVSNHKYEISKPLFPKSFFTQTQSFNGVARQTENVVKDNLSLKDTLDFKSTNRQNIILGLLKKKKELTIKDIAVIIKDVSEKTIQRELISLIEAGVLQKKGERRWSKYSLNIS